MGSIQEIKKCEIGEESEDFPKSCTWMLSHDWSDSLQTEVMYLERLKMVYDSADDETSNNIIMLLLVTV
jgi:hypothetical protein